MTKKHRRGSLYKRGAVYWLKFMVDGKMVYRSLETTILDDAEKKRAEIMRPLIASDTADALAVMVRRLDTARAEEQRIADEANPPLSIVDAWDAYVSAPNRPDSGSATLAQYSVQFSRFRKWLQDNYPELTRLRDVTPQIAEEFIGWLISLKRSGNTINKYRGLLALVFEALRGKARLEINPWQNLQRRKQKSVSRRELTIEEVRKVCGTAKGEMRLLFAFGIYTGMRLGDCATLEWGEVDIKRRRISRIPRKLENREGVKPLILSIHPELVGLLLEIPLADRHGHVLPKTAAAYQRRRTDVTGAIQAHFTACGINTLGDARGRSRRPVVVGFHSLRHTFVSIQAERGTPLSVVQAIVGHGNPAMTRHYTHIGEGAARAAINCLPAVIAEAGPAAPTAPPTWEDVRPRLAAMTEANWRDIRDALLAQQA